MTDPVVRNSVAIADPNAPQNVLRPNADGSINVNGGTGGGGGTGTNGSAAPTTSVSNGYTNGAGNQTAVSPSTPLPQYTAANENIVQTVINLAAGTSATLIAANAARKSLRWMVVGTNPMTVAPGTGTVTVGQGMNYGPSSGLGQQGGAESFTSDVPTNAFSAISAAGTTVAVWEGQ